MSNSACLPIEAIKSSFCQALVEHNTLILSAPPGAGKSTCLPLWLLKLEQLKQRKIYLLQPRRLAVKNIAAYLAKQLGESVGKTVGYRLRNESKVSESTRLEVITEGILTKVIQQDAELSGVGLIVFDEFHERSLHGDLAFALAREVQQVFREDLKLLSMSATLDVAALTNALPEAGFIQSEGRSYPVDIGYQTVPAQQSWQEHTLTVIKQVLATHQGSILVFLPGVADIRYLYERLNDVMPSDCLLSQLYGELSLNVQQQAILPAADGQRKLVLTTNVAETSLTIDGINLVIDCGLEKVAIYDNAKLINSLTQRQIAKASAIQRAGRAGRLMPGRCIRLFAKEDFERRPEQSVNEIQQADLLPTLIEAARWGVTKLSDLPMLELPKTTQEEIAWQELQALSIVDKNRSLTEHGEQISVLACHPRFAHMIISALASKHSSSASLASLACVIAALLEERDILPRQAGGDNASLQLRVELLQSGKLAHQAKAARIIKQAKNLARSAKINFTWQALPMDMIGVLLAFAYPERIAKARGAYGDFVCANGSGVSLREHEPLAEQSYLVVAALMQVKTRTYANLVAPISLGQIETFFADSIHCADVLLYDNKLEKVIARRQRKLVSMLLDEQVLSTDLSEGNVARVWSQTLQKYGIDFLNWQAKDLNLLARWQWLANEQKSNSDNSTKMPLIDEGYLLNNLSLWFEPYVADISAKAKLDKLDLSAMLLSLLDYQQQQILNQAAPTHYVGPTGRQCKISYQQGEKPKVSLPMQEVYGLSETPVVGLYQDRSVVAVSAGAPLLLELLSPAQRPIQVTQDLVQFWQGSYAQVQKDMKSKYPKHYWPDDPANAQPTNKTKRHMQSLKK